MKRAVDKRLFNGTALIGIILVMLLLTSPLATALTASPADEVNAAWKRATEIGVYHYRTSIIQTTWPTARLENMGRSSTEQRFYIEGEADRTNQKLALKLWADEGRTTSDQGAVEIKVEEGKTWGRSGADGAWQEVDGATTLFAPNQDLLTYLVAAKNVERLPLEARAGITLTRYSFELDGPVFAQYMRDQMEVEMQRRGELPPNVSLQTATLYAEMTGEGEIWLDGAGLPVRQLIHAQFPPAYAEQIEVQITTDFAQWGGVVADAAGGGRPALAATARRALSAEWGMVAVCAGLTLLMIQHWNTRRAYRWFAPVMIVALLLGPALQAQQVHAFYEDQHARQVRYEQQRAEQEQAEALEAEQQHVTFNPAVSPLEQAQQQRAAEAATANLVLTMAGLNQAQSVTEIAQTTASNDTDSDGDGLGDQLEQRIGANPSHPDTDGDGLNDGIEYNELGTDFTTADTDQDGIQDGVEAQGFLGGDGRRWYLNPLDPDTNKDSRADMLECPDLLGVTLAAVGNLRCADTDGDNTPNPFDLDDDNDGVPDKADLSPEVALGGGWQNGQVRGLDGQTFSLILDSLTPNKPVFVDFQVRPVNPNHLWYSLSMLDWPTEDREGQVRRISDSTFATYNQAHNQPSTAQDANGDMKLTPMLEIRIPFQQGRYGNLPVKAGAPAITPATAVNDWLDTAQTDNFGIAVKKLNEQGDLAVYVPLNVVRDPVSKSPVAFAGRMLYWLQDASFGQAHRARLVWLVSALVDVCTIATSNVNYDTLCQDPANWTTEIQTVQGYSDDWYLTGLEVREDHGLKVGVLFENPDLPPRADGYESDLWTMAQDLEQTFLGGRQVNGTRDITVDEIKRRFDSESNGGVDTITRWGFPPNAFRVATYTFSSQADVGYMAKTYTRQILTDYFISGGQIKVADPTLLFVREEKYRIATLDMSAAVVQAGPQSQGMIVGTQATIRMDPAQIPQQVLAGMNWAPYRYTNNAWEPYPIAEYWTKEMQPTFETLFKSEPGGKEAEANKGRVALAQNYYMAMLTGAAALVEKDGRAQTKLEPQLNTDVKLDAYYTYAKTAGSGVVSAARFVYDFIDRVVKGYKMANLSVGDSASMKILVALGSVQEHGIKGLLPGFLQSLLNKLSFRAQGIVIGLVIIAAGVYVAAAAVLWLVGKLTGNQVIQAIADYMFQAISGLFTALGLVSSAVEMFKGIANVIKGIAAGISKVAVVVAIITLVLTVAFAVGLFVFEWISSGWTIGSIEWLQALRGAVAAVLAAVIMLAIGLIPYVGPFIVALIGAFDFVVKLVCKIGNLQGEVCAGIAGMLQQDIAEWLKRTGLFSSFSYVMIDYAGRLQINGLKMSLDNPDKGLVVGNKVSIEADVTTNLYINPTSMAFYARPISGVDDRVRQSVFSYQVTPISTTQIHAKLALGQMNTLWTFNLPPCAGLENDYEALAKCVGDYQNRAPYYGRGDEARILNRFTRTQPIVARNVITLTRAGLNQPAPLYVVEGFVIPTESAWGGGSMARSTPVNLKLKFDVFPATLDEFYTLVSRGNNSAALAWDSRFPTLCDADGDSLRSVACAGNDPNDLAPDNDGDGLSDFVEMQAGSNPAHADVDQDGLTDYWETTYHTNPWNADSDGDGLRDGAETTGWAYTYAPGLQTWVTSNPLSADSDSDGIFDKQEQVYGFHPQMPSTGKIVSIVSQIDDADGYVKPGQTIAYAATIANNLNDRYARGLLEVALPVAVQNSSLASQVYTLKPRESATVQGQIRVDPNVQTSQWVNLTNRAGAILTDMRQETEARSLWLHLDENAGSSLFVDASLWGRNGGCMLVNGVPRQCPTAGDVGYIGQAVTFDGSTRYIRLPDAATLGLRDSSFTVMAWVKFNNVGGDLPVLGSVDVGVNQGLHLMIRNQKPYMGFYGNDMAGNATLTPYTWYHLTWRYDKGKGEQAIFVDGVLDAAQTGHNPFQGSGNLYVGRAFDTFFNGMLDEVEIYPRALTAEEIASRLKAPVLDLAFDDSLFDRSYHKHGAAYPMDNYPDFPYTRNGSRTVQFNRTQWFEILGDSSLDMSKGTGRFSMAMWIYPEYVDHWTSFLGKTTPNSNVEYLYPTLSYYDRTLRVSFGDGSDGQSPCNYVTDNNVLTLNSWQHLIVTFDGGQFVIYRDGQRVAAGAGSCGGRKPTPGHNFYLGRSSRAARITFHYVNVTGWEAGSWGSEYRLWVRPFGQEWAEVWTKNGVSGGETWINQSYDFYSDYDIAYTFRLWEDDWLFDDGWPADDELVGRDVNNRTVWDYQGFPYRGDSDGGTLYVTLQTNFFKGSLDDIRIYRYALSEVEAQALYRGQTQTLRLQFDEAPGATRFADSSGSMNDSACAGNTCPDTGLPGRANQAARFDGSNDYIPLKRAAKLGLYDSSFTVMAWVKSGDLSSDQPILGTLEGVTNQGLHLIIRNAKPYMAFWANDTSGNTTLSPNTWYHLAWKYDKTTGEQALFVNGVLDTAQAGHTPFMGTNMVYVGRAYSSYFNGLIDDLIIVNGALSTAEIQQAMAESPRLNLHLDEALGATTFVNASNLSTGGSCSGEQCPQAGTRGQIREAAVFDGVDDALTLSAATTLGLNNSSFTVAAWVNAKDLSGDRPILGGTEATTNQGLHLVLRNHKPYMGFLANDTAGNTALATNTWYHLVWRYDAAKQEQAIFVNGVLDAAQTGHAAFQGTGTVYLGRAFATYFNGLMDEVAVYNQSLSDQAIRQLYDYQAAWFDTTYAHPLIVDTQYPEVRLVTPAYLALKDTVLAIEARGPQSGIATVEYNTGAGWLPATRDGQVWLFTYRPDGAGNRTLQARATDNGGWASTDTKTVIVDNAPPDVTLDSALTQAVQVPAAQNQAWKLHLNGTAADASSGMTQLGVTLLDAANTIVGNPQVIAVSNGAWAVDYPFAAQPTGRYTVQLDAVDAVGNARRVSVGGLLVDGSAPVPEITYTGPVAQVISGVDLARPILQGTVLDAPYPADPALHLAFEEAPGGTFYDGSMNHLPATCSGATCPTSGPGKYGLGLQFDGVDDYVKAGDIATKNRFTLSAWVYPTGAGSGAAGIGGMIINREGEYEIARFADGSLLWAINNVNKTWDWVDTGYDVPLNQWTHIALVYDAGQVNTYANGALVHAAFTSAGDIGDCDPANNELRIGGRSIAPQNWAGWIDDVVIYDYALNAAQVQAMAHPASTGITQVEIGFEHTYKAASRLLDLPFDEAVGSSHFTDLASNAAASCAAPTCPIAGQPGKYGTALQFDGVDDYVNLGTAGYMGTDSQMTLSAWVYPTDAGSGGWGSGGIILNRESEYEIARFSDGSLNWAINNVNQPWYWVDTGYDVPLNQWTHIVLVYDAGQVSTYVNGAWIHSAYTGAGGMGGSTATDLRIGGRSIAPQNWAGRLDDIRIYRRALDAAEIQELAQTNNGYATQWYPVTLLLPSQTFTRWAFQTPAGLEGPYQIHLRATDTAGHTLLQHNVWQGEIDTLAPRVGFVHTQAAPGYYQVQCAAQDYNLTETGWACPLTTAPQRTYQTARWFTAVTHQSKLAGLTTPLQTVPATAGSGMQACDLYGNCTPVTCGMLENCTLPLAAQRAPRRPLAETGVSVILTPTQGANVFTSTAPMKLAGYVSATHSLRALTVTVGGAAVYTQTWGTDIPTATWTATWTPPAAGVYAIDARLTDGAGTIITDVTRPVIYVDTASPQISLSTSHITGQNYDADTGLLTLAGWVTDTAVARVEVQINAGAWQPAAEPAEITTGPQTPWRAVALLGQPPLSDTYTVAYRAVDVAGTTTTAQRVLAADVLPPTTTFTLTYLAQGREITLTAGDTITSVLHPTLTLRLDSADASGWVGYHVEWREELSQTTRVLATYDGTANTIPLAADEAQRLSLHIIARDLYSNTSEHTFAPIYVDYSATPVYASITEATPYRGWLAERCNLLGVDNRLAERTAELAGLSAAQTFYGGWDATGLRFTWAGANWDVDGDLFIYLDTVAAAGSARVYNPYPDAANTVILLPAGTTPTASMRADYALWVQNSQTATLMTWDGIQWATVISPQLQYVFDAPYTHLYVPFSSLGIANAAATPLSLVALATEENALKVWAVQPAHNNLNSTLAAEVLSARQQFVLRNRYQWPSLGAGVCPAGQPSGPGLRASQSSPGGLADVQASFTANPPGIAYSVLEDNLYFAQDDLFDELDVDWATLETEYCADYPDDPECDADKTAADLDFEAQEDLEDWMDVENAPVGDGDEITYTLTYANQGTETAIGLVLDVTTWGQVRLPAGEWDEDADGEYDYLVLPLGDLAPGETLTATFTGVIDLEFDPDNAEGWATIDAVLYDSTGSVDENQLDWLYVDHEIDEDAPDYLEIQTPQMLIAPGVNTFRGFVRDQSAVPTLALTAATPSGTRSTSCVDPTPDDGQWTCALNVGALDEGDEVSVHLTATDSHEQTSDATMPRVFIVDSTPPSVTLDLATQDVFTDGVIGPQERVWSGRLSDNRLVESVQVCDTTSGQETCAAASIALENPPQTSFTYEDTLSATLGAATPCTGGLIRTFTITDSFTVGDLNVGLTFDHTYRDDIEVFLTSPAGTRVTLLTELETEAANLDVLFDDASDVYPGDDIDDHETTAPYYENVWSPADYLSDFNGEAAAGVWRLTLCDSDPGADDGRYQRSQLYFTANILPTDTTASWHYLLPTPTNSDGEARYTVSIYSLDSVGNRSTLPLTRTYRWDNVPPVITVSAIMSGSLGVYTNTVLRGNVSDGTQVNNVFISGYTPLGDFFSAPADLTVDGNWSYDLPSSIAGSYTLWVYAVDQANNQSTVGPFEMTLIAPPQIAKTVIPTRNVPLGGIVTYTLTLTNPNTGPLVGVVITDPLPAELTFITQTAGTLYLPPPDTLLTWGPYTMAGGAVYTLTFTARVTNTHTFYAAQVYNTAYATSVAAGTGKAQAVFTIEDASPMPILMISKTVTTRQTPVQLGDPVTYTIIVANVGTMDAAGVLVTDTLPSGIIGAALNETIAVSAGTAHTFTLPARIVTDTVYAGQTLTNTAAITHTSSGRRFAQVSVTIAGSSSYAIYLPVVAKNYSASTRR